MKTRRKKHSRLWVCLLYLELVTSLILSVTLARYASDVAGTGAATVAAMAGGGEPIQMMLDRMTPGGEPRTLRFQVVNYSGDMVSEVAVDYQITVETTGNLPLRFTLSADETENAVRGGAILENGQKTQTLTGGSFPLPEGRQAHTYTLSVEWPEGENDAGYAQEIDCVTVTVEARQRLSGDA